jgi:Na+/H+-translocating membrane pyrophosphatase
MPCSDFHGGRRMLSMSGWSSPTTPTGDVDNARGLAEMGGLGEEALRVADELDSRGIPSRP